MAGRAGRESLQGNVVIQTHHPEHPVFHDLLSQSYGYFAKASLKLRQECRLPPYFHLALFRAEAPALKDIEHWLNRCLERIQYLMQTTAAHPIECIGPMPSPMERRNGRFHHQLLLKTPNRNSLHHLLNELIPMLEKESKTKQLRWSLDIDPLDML